MLKGRNFLETGDLSSDELEEIFILAGEIMEDPGAYAHMCEGKLLSTLFFSPVPGQGYHLRLPC